MPVDFPVANLNYKNVYNERTPWTATNTAGT